MNWKTTLSGVIAAVLPYAKTILPVELAPVIDAISTLAIACLGYFAADKR